jgi:hypothetical protein
MLNNFNNLPNDIIYIISDFLLPRDILRFRRLSKYYKEIISIFLIKKKGKIDIYDFICPLCGNDWISTDKYSLNEFYDIDNYTHFGEFHQRNDYILQNHPANIIYRDHILCDECENITIEKPNIYDFKLYNSNIYLYIDSYSLYPWAYLIKYFNDRIIWNQFNCIIEYINEEDEDIEDIENYEDMDNYEYIYNYENED